MQIGGELGVQVGEVVGQIARGMRAGAQQGADLIKTRQAAANQMSWSDDGAFFDQARGARRHGTRCDAADFGVMRPIGDVADEPPFESNTGVMSVMSGRCDPPNAG
jgi:hypothetical protein